MRNYVLNGIATAMTSISHNGGESYGVNSIFRREKFAQPNGDVEEVPVISGNALRGVLRDVGMTHMLRTLGLQVNLPAYHFLLSGGSLTSDGGKALDVDQARRVRELIPLVGVFGGALGSAILPGKLDCGKAYLICNETAHLLPASATAGRNLQPFTAYVQEEMYTRRDDAKDDHKTALLLDSGTRTLLDQARVAKKAKAAEPQEDTGQHQQMRYFVETLCAGSSFSWRLVLRDVTDIEFEAFAVTLAEWSKRPVIGGKANVGMGELSVSFRDWCVIDPRITAGVGLAAPLGSSYLQHLRDNGATIREFLAGMAKAA